MAVQRSRSTALAVLCAAVLVLAGCGSGGSDDANGPVTITFTSYTYGQQNPGGEGLAKLLADFRAAHPDIVVTPKSVPVADSLTVAQSGAAAGNPPDVAQIGWNNVAQAARTLPLRSFTDIAGPAAQQELSGFTPAVLQGAPTRSGGLVALPWLVNTPILMYNKSLFGQAGLDPNKPPTTFTQVEQAALAIKGKGLGDGVYVDAVNSPGYSDGVSQALVNGVGGQGLATPDGQPTVATPPVVTALASVQRLVASGAMPPVQTTSAVSAFSSGKLGMLVYTAAGLPTMKQAAAGKWELGTAPFPQVVAGTPARTTLIGNGLTILSSDDRHARAAWELVRFLTSDEAYRTITSQMGYPSLRPAEAGLAEPLLAPAVDQLAAVEPYTVFAHQPSKAVQIFQQQGVAPIVLQGADPARTLQNVEAQIRALR